MPIPERQRAALLAQAKALCKAHDATLLFLSVFGSHLYGTDIPGTSDVDVRGIFLPSLRSLALNDAPHSLHSSTGDKESRNSAEDTDIDLWSLQHWLLDLLPAGDTGALDLFFAPSHEACTLHRCRTLDDVFAHPELLINMESGKSYAAYSLGQARKYGIKGSRVGALRRVWHWLEENGGQYHPTERLLPFMEGMVARCDDDRFCRVEETREGMALNLCGKLHMGKIRMEEFAHRVQADMQRYGVRAQEAERNQGIDFKALSHAVRALYQMEELLQKGRIIFPLRQREELRDIKHGKRPWQELEPYILNKLQEVEQLQSSAPHKGQHTPDFARRCILKCYGLHGAQPPVKKHPPAEPGFEIPTATRQRILERLAGAETENNVRILYACESGSRAWGFASRDSDFDVRFIYVHPPEWYLSVAPEERRDVIELGIENTVVGELDINGWELRKALKLYRRSNPPLFEWLSSPVVYLECGTLAQSLRDLAPKALSPLGAWHHYHGLMRKSRARYWEKRRSVKALFYMLRPLITMRWLELGRGVPPMRFDLLVDGVVEDAGTRQAIRELVELKRQGGEQQAFTPDEHLLAYFEELIPASDECAQLAPSEARIDLDGVFRTVLAEAFLIMAQ
jgi:hypothetical protein